MTDIELEEQNKKYATVVAKIIDEGFAKKRELGDPEKLLDQYVYSMIKKRLPLPQIYNAAIRAGTDTDCGITNLDEGAKAILRDALKSLPYDIDSDKMISPRTQKRRFEVKIQLGGEKHIEVEADTPEQAADLAKQLWEEKLSEDSTDSHDDLWIDGIEYITDVETGDCYDEHGESY